MTFKFFKYELKKSLWPIIILTIIGALIYIPILATSNFTYNYDYINIYPYSPSPNIIAIAIFLCIICTITPVYEFSFLMKKRSVDNYYSFPIKRSHIIMFKFISGFIKIFISYTAVFFLGLFVVLMKENNFYIGQYFPYYIFSILLGFSLYAFNCFVFSRANTIIDGFIFIGFYIFMFALITTFIRGLIKNNELFNISGTFSYSPIFILTDLYDNLIRYGSLERIPDIKTYDFQILSYIIWSIFGGLSIFGLIYSTKKDKAERSEQISESYFGYRVLIPVFTVLFIDITGINIFLSIYSIVILAIIFGFIITMYIIYRRTFKLSSKYWLIISGTVIFALLFV